MKLSVISESYISTFYAKELHTRPTTPISTNISFHPHYSNSYMHDYLICTLKASPSSETDSETARDQKELIERVVNMYFDQRATIGLI